MFIVEGNIGAGKSTFLKLIAQYRPHITIALEPVNTWQNNVFGQSLLANFYQNPKRWAYSMETFAMLCRVREHIIEQQNPNPFRIIERSIYSGHYVFTHNSYEAGFMTDFEWHMYNQWFDYLIPKKCHDPHGFIYLQTSPEIAYERIKKRNRLAEKKITIAYLKQIHQQHEKFLMQKIGLLPSLKNVPVMVLDCNQEFEENPFILNQFFDSVELFIQQYRQESGIKQIEL